MLSKVPFYGVWIFVIMFSLLVVIFKTKKSGTERQKNNTVETTAYCAIVTPVNVKCV